MFLASHGRGAELRNIALAVTLGTILALIVCIPAFGIVGAAWAAAFAMLFDYLLHLFYYRRLKRMLQSGGAVAART
jgi:Na+-driven multidrug efflux pump